MEAYQPFSVDEIIDIQSTLDTLNFKGLSKTCQVISSSRLPNDDI